MLQVFIKHSHVNVLKDFRCGNIVKFFVDEPESLERCVLAAIEDEI